jgi:hypothetical protein
MSDLRRCHRAMPARILARGPAGPLACPSCPISRACGPARFRGLPCLPLACPPGPACPPAAILAGPAQSSAGPALLPASGACLPGLWPMLPAALRGLPASALCGPLLCPPADLPLCGPLRLCTGLCLPGLPAACRPCCRASCGPLARAWGLPCLPGLPSRACLCRAYASVWRCARRRRVGQASRVIAPKTRPAGLCRSLSALQRHARASGHAKGPGTVWVRGLPARCAPLCGPLRLWPGLPAARNAKGPGTPCVRGLWRCAGLLASLAGEHVVDGLVGRLVGQHGR